MQPVSATDVRKNWSSVCDDVARNRPVFVKRTRDEMVMASTEDMKNILEGLRYHVDIYMEADGSVTAALREIDLAENGSDKETACTLLSEAILEYAEEYYSEFQTYRNAPNRRAHLPYVIKAILLREPASIKEEMVCRNGKI